MAEEVEDAGFGALGALRDPSPVDHRGRPSDRHPPPRPGPALRPKGPVMTTSTELSDHAGRTRDDPRRRRGRRADLGAFERPRPRIVAALRRRGAGCRRRRAGADRRSRDPPRRGPAARRGRPHVGAAAPVRRGRRRGLVSRAHGRRRGLPPLRRRVPNCAACSSHSGQSRCSRPRTSPSRSRSPAVTRRRRWRRATRSW